MDATISLEINKLNFYDWCAAPGYNVATHHRNECCNESCAIDDGDDGDHGDDDDDPPPAFLCSSCSNVYHGQCLDPVLGDWNDATHRWVCPVCVHELLTRLLPAL